MDIKIPEPNVPIANKYDLDKAFTQERILKSQCLNIATQVIIETFNNANVEHKFELKDIYDAIIRDGDYLYKKIKKDGYL